MGLGRRGSLAIGALAPLMASLAQAAPFQNATIRRIVDGRQVYIDQQQARVNQTAGKGQQLSTGDSRTELLFDRRALGFLGRNSQIRLGQDCFRLSAGTVLINGPQRACLGSKVLGVRGTTYVLSKQPDQTYELAVLTGEAELADAHRAMASDGESADILQRYPSLSPVVGLGSSAYGSNAGGLALGQAAGLILGNLSVYAPLWQEQGSRIAYSYTTANSNFGGFWGASSEVGYRWFDPNNQANSGLLVGYDGWQQPGCFHSQVALGAEWERNRWQLSAQGGIPVAACNDNLGYAMAELAIPVANLGHRAIQLGLAPYVLNGIGNSYGGGRIGLRVPVGNQVDLSAYGQYDDLLNTVVGGMINYRFATAGRFVRDPNLRPGRSSSPLPWLNSQWQSGQPMQLALGNSSTTLDAGPALLGQASTGAEALIKAGEVANIGANGTLLSKAPLSRERYSQLIQANLQGQNLLPESHAIAKTYQALFGMPPQTVLATTGMDWLIASRTPFPRLRGADVLVVPANKLPQTSSSTTYTYVCQGTGPGDYFPGGPLSSATRFTSSSPPTTADCAAKAGGIYLTPVLV
jgi:hypothetical protein